MQLYQNFHPHLVVIVRVQGLGFRASGFDAWGSGLGVLLSGVNSKDEGFKTIVLPYGRYMVRVSYTPKPYAND